uniref:Uncharacterized protein n=1 Tax=Rhizophora mucronata TaxID=61149 RepID=A0A2P2R083_RHIMU
MCSYQQTTERIYFNKIRFNKTPLELKLTSISEVQPTKESKDANCFVMI